MMQRWWRLLPVFIVVLVARRAGLERWCVLGGTLVLPVADVLVLLEHER